MVESGRMIRSTEEWEISRSCHRATSSNAAWTLARTTRARPQICSQVTGLRLWGMAELPFCQKVNFLLVSILLAILYVTGLDTIIAGTHHNLIFGGHKLATIALGVLVAGHLYMALVNPPTRPALGGMLAGGVDRGGG